MSAVTVVDSRNRLGRDIRTWLIAKGYPIGFMSVDPAPDLEHELPYLDVFEPKAQHRGHGLFIARLRKRRRIIGTLAFCQDWRTGNRADERNWVLECDGTDAHVECARILAKEMASHFEVNIKVERKNSAPRYEKFPSEFAG